MYELRLTVVANQKQLLKLYSPSCSEPPTCVHRWSLRLQKFDFKLEYKPGMNNIVDALSRKPFFDTYVYHEVNKAGHFINCVVSNSLSKTLKFHVIREATQSDQIPTKVCDAIIND